MPHLNELANQRLSKHLSRAVLLKAGPQAPSAERALGLRLGCLVLEVSEALLLLQCCCSSQGSQLERNTHFLAPHLYEAANQFILPNSTASLKCPRQAWIKVVPVVYPVSFHAGVISGLASFLCMRVSTDTDVESREQCWLGAPPVRTSQSIFPGT